MNNNKATRPRWLIAWILGCSLFLGARPELLLAGTPSQPLSELSLQELGNVPGVVSSKFPSQLFNAPTGSFVFDDEAIQNLPVDSIPEMLRYAPGVHIVRPSNGIWGMGMRGINSRFFNRVLFTVDEQNVYSTIFAGLFGNQHDLLKEDISSIEVAYGPGGGTWDNNAVNGRVNVLMKTAFETEGGLLRTHAGTESRGVAARVGWSIDESTAARVYLKGSSRDGSETRFDYSNQWDTARGGFRIDKQGSDSGLFSLSGEAFYSSLGYAYNLADFATGDLDFVADNELLKGVSAQAKWTRELSNDTAYSVRSWATYSDLDAPYAAFGMGTAGIEARGGFRLSESHRLSLNAGGAYDQQHTRPTLAADWNSEYINNFAAYAGIQDEWSLIPEKLLLSTGLDLRYDDKSSSSAYSPNARLIHQLNTHQRLWVSYSKAKRATPVSLTVIESLRSGKAIDPPLQIPTPFGNFELDRNLTNANSTRELKAESMDAFEVGYRANLANQRGHFGINGFLYKYDDIIARIGTSALPQLFVPHPYLSVQGSYENLLEGEAYGFEAHFNWELADWIEASLSYSRLTDSFDPLIGSADPFVASSIQFSVNEFDHSSPEHMATLNLSADLSDQWNLNTGLRYTDSYNFAKGLQPSIFQLDTRLSWQAKERLRLSLVGRNLLDSKTQEARLKDFFGHWTEMKRELYLEVKAEF